MTHLRMFGTPWKSYLVVSVSIVPIKKMNWMAWLFYNGRYINKGIKTECYILCFGLLYCVWNDDDFVVHRMIHVYP